jgi:sn-glycerol 3-phosphate transport system substrate-binding protein
MLEAAARGRPARRRRCHNDGVLRPRRGFVAIVLSLCTAGVLVSACSSSNSSSPATTSASSTCSPSALSKASSPVTINFWESAARANVQVLTALTQEFNSSQNKVVVNLVSQPSYDDTWQKYQSGLSNGELPDIVQLQDTDTQGAIDTQSFQPVQNCMSGFGYKTGDLLPRALSYWNVDNVQWGMPFAVSGPVLFYNRMAFQKAGLDPDQPPSTLPELVADAAVLHQHGLGGMGLKLDPWLFESWLATGNQLLADNGNGRTARSTKVVFDTAAGTQIFSEMDQMVANGDASTNSALGADQFDNLLGVGSGKYSMTIDTSAALGTIQEVLATGQYPSVELGVAPFPKAAAGSTGGVQPAGSALWISKRSSAAKQAAAWEYAAFLDSTASQETWSVGTGYMPLRTSSAQSASVQSYWTKNPGFEVPYTQLVDGPQTYATDGALLGPFDDVRTAIASAEGSMADGGVSPSSAIASAANASDRLIQNYNQRLGTG